MKKLWLSITKKEWRAVAIISLAVIILTGLPYLYGYLQSTPQLIYVGWHAQTPVDFAVYISYIRQIADGNYLIRDLFTTEPQPRGMLNFAWLAVGLFGRIFRLDPRLAFHLSRLILAPILLIIGYLFISYIFNDKKSRLLGLGLFAFGGGWGIYGLPLFAVLAPRVGFFDRAEYWPADLDITESFVFSAIYQSPHFILSWSFLLLTFLLYLVACETRQLKYFFFAGLSALVFFNFHPYYAFLIFGVEGLYYAYLAAKDRRIDWRLIAGHCLAVGLGAISVLYHWRLISVDPVIGGRAAGNVTMVYFILPFIFCFGAFLWLAAAGIILAKKNGALASRLIFFLVWIGVSLALIFFPNPFQRHFYEGLFFPLLIFSVIALGAIAQRLKEKMSRPMYNLLTKDKVVLTALLFLIFSLTNAFNLTRDYYYFSHHFPLFYLSADDNSALNWLARQPEAGKAVLAGEYFSHLIPGLTGHEVFAGHGIETLNYNNKKIAVLWFYSGNGNDRQKEEWLASSGIEYVYFSPDEERLGEFDPEQKPYLKLQKRFGQTAIYRVRAD